MSFTAKNKFSILLLALGLVLCAPQAKALADASSFIEHKDLQVAVRTFGFAYNLPKGDLVIEVVYNPSVADSSAEAAALKNIIGDGIKIGNRMLHAQQVSVADLGKTGSKIAYITHGLAQDYDKILKEAGAHSILTFTTDFQCVSQQKCVMGVKAEPNIKIEVSRAATEASSLEFSQALKLMIQEVE